MNKPLFLKNVLGDFKPLVPDEYKKSQFVYLANNDPEQNTKLIKEFDNVKFSMCDTIDFWISTKRNAVIKGLKSNIINELLPLLIISSLIGARAYYVIFQWRNYSGDNFWNSAKFFNIVIHKLTHY